MKYLLKIFSILTILLFASTGKIFAHEQYVLSKHQLDMGFADKSTHIFDAFNKPENVMIGLTVGIGIAIVISIYFFFQFSKFGRILDGWLQKLEHVGHLLIRISLGASLIASAYYNAFLGPEIPAQSLHLGTILVPALFVLGILLVFGLFVRIASLLGFLILIVATIFYGEYMITYFNYFGEYLALFVFGSYFLSVDNRIFGISKLVSKYKDWEILVLRTTYGLSVLYPAITIKLLHPAVIVEIYTKYHMGKIWWLFPQDPLLTSLGTGMAQILVGVLIVIGLETRLAALATFLLYLGSIVFFQEAVWPHIVLLALAFYFVINNGGKYTIDNLIGKKYFAVKKSKKYAK